MESVTAPSGTREDRSLENDDALRAEVIKELEWDPEVDAAHVGVAVTAGAVTLTGRVSSYPEKLAAVRAAERVLGVRAVADEIQVVLPGSRVHDDADLARLVAAELRRNALVPDTVKAEVRGGVVTLRGEVEWFFQREEAERAVQVIEGVTGITNDIRIKPPTKPTPEEVRRRVTEAFERAAAVDASNVSILVDDGTIVLGGRVHSMYERALAEEVARAAPGATEVVNEIVVDP